jgi:hypothetical protein
VEHKLNFSQKSSKFCMISEVITKMPVVSWRESNLGSLLGQYVSYTSSEIIFMFVPCINNIKALFIFHNDAHNYKIAGILKPLKFRRSVRHVSVHAGTIIREPFLCLAKTSVMVLYPRRLWRGQCHGSILTCCADVRHTVCVHTPTVMLPHHIWLFTFLTNF